MFQETTALHKISALRKRIRVVPGGTSASKTISILMWLIDYAQCHDNELISVVSASYPHLKRGAIRDFMNIMTDRGYFVDADWNKTESTYTFETGSKIEFFSADQPGKVRGPRRDILFINEANNVPYETYDQLEVRTKKIIWIDYNPTNEFWVYDQVLGSNECDFLTLTYKDNEGLDENIIKSIESRKDNKSWWQVYGLGQLGEVEGKIYTGWKLDVDLPHEARLVSRGLDFGYSNDPAAIIDIYLYNGGYILDEQLYKIGMNNRQIADFINNLPEPMTMVVADSAEPKSIDELREYGVSVIGANKGPGSVNQGIQWVQAQQVSITKRSLNLKKAYQNYMWMTDKEGNILNKPDHFMSDTLDAVRYGMESQRPRLIDDTPVRPSSINTLIY